MAAGIQNKVPTADTTDDPIPPQFLHLFSTRCSSNSSAAALFLKQQGRRIESVLGDGNCLFRSLAFILHENQDMHVKTREDITHFIKQHKQKFQPYLTQGRNIDRHLQNMAKDGTWGTQVELLGAATFYKVPIYIASTSQDHQEFHWRKYTPLTNLTGATEARANKSHIELAHLDSCHFDPIVPIDSNSHNSSQPTITTKHHQGGTID